MNEVGNHLSSQTSPESNWWLIYSLVTIGVLVFYLFSVQKDFQGTHVALRKMFPHLSDLWVDRIDLLIVITLGPILAYHLFNPSTPAAAITAGLGWVGALNTVGGKK